MFDEKRREYSFEEVTEIINVKERYNRMTDSCLKVIGRSNNIDGAFLGEIYTYRNELGKYPKFFPLYKEQFEPVADRAINILKERKN